MVAGQGKVTLGIYISPTLKSRNIEPWILLFSLVFSILSCQPLQVPSGNQIHIKHIHTSIYFHSLQRFSGQPCLISIFNPVPFQEKCFDSDQKRTNCWAAVNRMEALLGPRSMMAPCLPTLNPRKMMSGGCGSFKSKVELGYREASGSPWYGTTSSHRRIWLSMAFLIPDFLAAT